MLKCTECGSLRCVVLPASCHCSHAWILRQSINARHRSEQRTPASHDDADAQPAAGGRRPGAWDFGAIALLVGISSGASAWIASQHSLRCTDLLIAMHRRRAHARTRAALHLSSRHRRSGARAARAAGQPLQPAPAQPARPASSSGAASGGSTAATLSPVPRWAWKPAASRRHAAARAPVRPPPPARSPRS